MNPGLRFRYFTNQPWRQTVSSLVKCPQCPPLCAGGSLGSPRPEKEEGRHQTTAEGRVGEREEEGESGRWAAGGVSGVTQAGKATPPTPRRTPPRGALPGGRQAGRRDRSCPSPPSYRRRGSSPDWAASLPLLSSVALSRQLGSLAPEASDQVCSLARSRPRGLGVFGGLDAISSQAGGDPGKTGRRGCQWGSVCLCHVSRHRSPSARFWCGMWRRSCPQGASGRQGWGCPSVRPHFVSYCEAFLAPDQAGRAAAAAASFH